MEDFTSYHSTDKIIESGRKYESTAVELLRHLISLGWSPNSELIRKYVREQKLEQELELICQPTTP